MITNDISITTCTLDHSYAHVNYLSQADVRERKRANQVASGALLVETQAEL